MSLIDISLTISPGMTTWPGDPAVTIVHAKRRAAGDAANVSALALGTHTGTHVDPPSHFIDGAAGADALPLGALIGRAVVVDLRGRRGAVGRGVLERAGIARGTKRVLLKTESSTLWRMPNPPIPESYTCLAPDAAAWLVESGISLVGIDALSIEEAGDHDHPVHTTLLRAGLVIVEGLDLHAVEPGDYELLCLPLKIAGGDGAPARAVLRTLKGAER